MRAVDADPVDVAVGAGVAFALLLVAGVALAVPVALAGELAVASGLAA